MPKKKTKNPILFSKYFNLDESKLLKMGILDPFLNIDTKLFIDPLLLPISQHKEIHELAYKEYKDFFLKVLKLLKASKKTNDTPWKAADRLLNIKEIKGMCLGYSSDSIQGNSIGEELRSNIIFTAKEIIDLGIDDPEMFSLLGILEEGIGPDRISDLTSNIIIDSILKLNERILDQFLIEREKFYIKGNEYNLVRHPLITNKKIPIILTPIDILRDLPIANGWDDISSVASKNQDLRNKVNSQIGDIWSIKTKKDKEKIRENLLKSKEAFNTFLQLSKKLEKESYDRYFDPIGFFLMRKILNASLEEKYPLELPKHETENIEYIITIVEKIIEHFIELVEKKGLWRELWHEDKHRNESAAQRMFFGIADVYCKYNNIDITPESDSGAGPVDFKFSKGYESRVVVEVKLSSNTQYKHGYEKQLEIYKEAESTDTGYFLFIDIDNDDEKFNKKLHKINKIYNEQIAQNRKASKIYVVDGNKKKSASKR